MNMNQFTQKSRDALTLAQQITVEYQNQEVAQEHLALALLRGESITIPAVARRNGGELPQLAKSAIIEAPLTLEKGEEKPHGYQLPGELAEVCGEIAETNTLAAQAATGDRTALRQCVELDPALAGLDRLYCQELVDKMIELHQDVLPRL